MTDINQTTDLPSDGGVWVTVAELARRKDITRQTASEKVAKLESEGRIQTRRDGRSRLVELASYDRAVGQVGNASREMGAETRRDLDGRSDVAPSSPQGPAAPPANAALRDAQTERARYDAQLKALELAERTGAVVPVKGDHGVETALVKVAEKMLRDLNAPLQWVTEIMSAAREGEPALRRLLRTKIREQRGKVASSLMELAGDAAESEAAGVTVDLDIEDET